MRAYIICVICDASAQIAKREASQAAVKLDGRRMVLSWSALGNPDLLERQNYPFGVIVGFCDGIASFGCRASREFPERLVRGGVGFDLSGYGGMGDHVEYCFGGAVSGAASHDENSKFIAGAIQRLGTILKSPVPRGRRCPFLPELRVRRKYTATTTTLGSRYPQDIHRSEVLVSLA